MGKGMRRPTTGATNRRYETPEMNHDPVLHFIGIGAARCGTTWLSQCLAEHPEIAFSPRKELHFFNNDSLYRREGIDWLHAQFEQTPPGRVRGEFTPRYLASSRAMYRVQRHFPDAKLIICLRDPVDRLISQYRYLRFDRFREPHRDIRSAMEGANFADYVVKGRYAELLRRIYDLFPAKNVHVVAYEAITSDRAEFRRLFRFLGVDAEFAPPSLEARVNRSSISADGPRILAALHCQIALLKLSHPVSAWLQWRARDAIMRSSRQLTRYRTRELPLGHVLYSHEKKRIFDTYFREDVRRLSDEFGITTSAWGDYETR